MYWSWQKVGRATLARCKSSWESERSASSSWWWMWRRPGKFLSISGSVRERDRYRQPWCGTVITHCQSHSVCSRRANTDGIRSQCRRVRCCRRALLRGIHTQSSCIWSNFMSTAQVASRTVRVSDFRSVARLDWAEVRRSRWLLLCIVLYGFLCGAFVLFGMRESSFMGLYGHGQSPALFGSCAAATFAAARADGHRTSDRLQSTRRYA